MLLPPSVPAGQVLTGTTVLESKINLGVDEKVELWRCRSGITGWLIRDMSTWKMQ